MSKKKEKKKFVAIVGTNTKEATNRKLLQFMKKHYEDTADIELMEITDLPMFNKPPDKQIPARANEMARDIDLADGVIISTPEYDHAVPAILMNAIEWLSYGIHPLADKPVMIIGASFGTLGTSRAQGHLRQILDAPEVHARVMPSSEYLVGQSLQIFDESGLLTDQEKIEQLDALFADFEQFVDVSKDLWRSAQTDIKVIEKLESLDTEDKVEA